MQFFLQSVTLNPDLIFKEQTNMQKIELGSRLELFRGCVAPGVRMSDELSAFYSDTPARITRARSASGIRIALVTDAVEMEYSLAFGAASREVYTSDIVADGKVTTVEGAGPHKFSFAPGEKEIVIHLPHLVVAEKIFLAVDDGAFVKAAPQKARKLLICGDSIMQGMTCTSPLKSMAALLAEKLDMDFHNTSVGGAVLRAEPVAQTIALGGDVILVGFGINDTVRPTPPEQFREQARKVFELLENFPGKSFFVVPLPTTKVDPVCREEYCRMIRDEHTAFPGVTLIEGADFYPADDAYFVDGLHPNDKGMALYADSLTLIMKPLLG